MECEKIKLFAKLILVKKLNKMEFLDLKTEGLTSYQMIRLKDLFDLSQKYLQSIKRRSGESYSSHGLEVANTVYECMHDPELMGVALLHDLLVHKEGEDILDQSILTDQERDLIRNMNQLRRLHIDLEVADLNRVLNSFLDDYRLLILRMAHRLNDIRHLDRFSPDLKAQIALETLSVYAALAGRMGLNSWKHELEEVSFKTLYPKIYDQLLLNRKSSEKIDLKNLEHLSRFIKEKMKTHGISGEVSYRIKAPFSIYQKMTLKNLRYQDISDRLGVRIVVGSIMECYRALGVVQTCLKPISGRLKDYIAFPKENGYQSIHTVVSALPGEGAQVFEIQIRTKEMDQWSSFGNAAHGGYKAKAKSITRTTFKASLIKSIRRASAYASKNSNQVNYLLEKTLNHRQIIVFDPDQNAFPVKSASNALDFVLKYHSKNFNQVDEIRINGKKLPLNTVLQDGDIIEVIFIKPPQ